MKYELTLTTDYVKDWTITSAIRELFQNAIDQQEASGVAYSFDYDPHREILKITSPCAWLSRSSLLLGETTKADAETQIGKFGEGYKLASLVFLREGLKVKIFNENFDEVWTAVIRASKRYNGKKILMFDIEGKLIYTPTYTDRDLVFEVHGVTNGMWEEYKSYNLVLCPPVETLADESNNRILLDEEFHGKVFMGGLYVGTLHDMQYGYDLTPGSFTIDRDRRMLPSFDIFWLTSRMWAQTDKVEMILKMLESNTPDVQYLSSSSYAAANVATAIHTSFVTKYGPNAYPVSNDAELRALKQLKPDKEPVIVTEQHKATILQSANFIKEDLSSVTTTKGRLKAWVEKVTDKLSAEELAEVESIINDMY
jgi:hypothetical protein